LEKRQPNLPQKLFIMSEGKANLQAGLSLSETQDNPNLEKKPFCWVGKTPTQPTSRFAPRDEISPKHNLDICHCEPLRGEAISVFVLN